MSKDSVKRVKCPKCGSENVLELYPGVCLVGYYPNTEEIEVDNWDVNDWEDCSMVRCQDCEEEWEKE